jgi:hypothetical protein
MKKCHNGVNEESAAEKFSLIHAYLPFQELNNREVQSMIVGSKYLMSGKSKLLQKL